MQMIDASQVQEPSEEQIDLRQYAVLIKDWLWLLILAGLLSGLTAYLTSRLATPIYQTTTTLLINQARSSNNISYQDILSSERIAKTYAELMTRRPIIERAALQLGIEPSQFSKEVTRITVSPVADTQLIKIVVEDDSAELAAAVANVLPEVFIAENEQIQTQRFASSKANLSRQLETLNHDIVNTQTQIDRFTGGLVAADESELSRLRLTLSQYQNSYASLLQSFEALRLTEAQSTDTVTVVEPARVPSDPVRPRPMRNLLLAALLGVAIALGVVFLIEYMDDTVKSPDDLRNLVNLTWLGTIARIGGADTTDSFITVNEPRHPISEAYRSLRTNLQFSAIDGKLGAIAVTSANPGEGKTTTVSNLAVVMAQAGHQVILVDADLRRPRIHKLFELTNNVGLTSAIMEIDAPVTSFLRPTRIENLRVLPSGPIPPNPAELLGSSRMKSLLEKLGQEADIVICDTPPALVVTDAAVLGRQVDGVVVVIDAGKTRRDAAVRAIETLYGVKVRILGAVLNRLTRSVRGYYYQYDGYYQSDQDEQALGQQRRRARRRGPLADKDRLPAEGALNLAKSEQ